MKRCGVFLVFVTHIAVNHIHLSASRLGRTLPENHLSRSTLGGRGRIWGTSMETLKRYMLGRHTPVEIRRHLAVLVVVYWGLVFCAWLGYPAEHKYSVTTNTLSALGSFDGRHNPEWYWLFSVAMVYCGLTMTPVILYIRHRLRTVSDLGARVGALFFLVGCVAIVLTGLFPDAHDRVIGDWQWRQIHRNTAGLIAVGFSLGIVWHGMLLLWDKLTKKTFAERGQRPYLTLIGPFLVCLPVFVAVGFRIRWESLWAATRAAATASGREIAADLSVALHGLQSFPLLEHVAIWALTIFVVWFAAVLPHEE